MYGLGFIDLRFSVSSSLCDLGPPVGVSGQADGVSIVCCMVSLQIPVNPKP